MRKINDQNLYLIRVALATIGLSSASIVSWELLQGLLPSCAPGFQCATVLYSSWMKPLGVSISYMGWIYFVVMLALNVVLFTGTATPALRKWSLWLSWLGGAFAVYAFLAMGVLIDAWCQWCLISASMMLGLALTAQYEQFVLKKSSN